MEQQALLKLIERAAVEQWEELDLSGHRLKTLPPEIGQLRQLKKLILGKRDKQKRLIGNYLEVLPSELSQLQQLEALSIAGNYIQELPDWIPQLQKISSLDASGNYITNLSESLGQLTNLTSLDLSRNGLNELPEWLGQLTNLTSLNLSSNGLKELPEWLGQLTNLTSLHLEKNEIKSIPLEMSQLTSLSRLVLSENPIRNIPPEILRKGWGEHSWKDGEPQLIFDYLTAFGKRPLNELKILLVGEGDVGKTSLLNRLVKGTFNPREAKTPGINIVKGWNLPQGDPNIKLNVWDFGGQRVMHATHQFFLTKRSLYLLVIDNRKNEQQNQVEYWLKLIETYGGESPVIIVGNCSDESPLDIKQRSLRKKYPQVKGFVSTSCQNGEGIPQLRKIIAKQIDSIQHVRDLLPNPWFEIKERLEEMQSQYDFISYEKYQDFCVDSDIREPEDQRNLVSFLHDLGVVINFQEDERLNDTNVLNPEWVTSGIYDILNNHDLMLHKKGVLKLSDLDRILEQPARYPNNKRRFLMGLMEKFELCFQFSGYRPEQYLITDLLPIDEPDVDIYEKAPLHFRYRYDILPSSIISRFIVRNHTMIYKNMRWRSGAVLTQDLNKALVRADEEDNFISIKVEGSRASALLAAIRSDFDKIHKTIKLPVRERLVIKEIQHGNPTGREVPVDYNYLCELDRDGISETSLPDLRGRYNVRDLLEGVESQMQRQENLDDRLARSRSSRSSRPLDTLEKPQSPNFFKAGTALLVMLAVVAAIFAVIAHYVPALQLVVIVVGILLAFSIIGVFLLRITNTIQDDVFGKALSDFWKTVPRINKGDSDKESDDTETD